MAYNRAAFFASIRKDLFGGALQQHQVEGCEAILAEAERRPAFDRRFLAYMLATAYWETARTMQPISEYGRGRGKAYGNPDPATLQAYYGRGLVQLTWKANYAKMAPLCGVDLVAHPDLALEPSHAGRIMFEGMLAGSFTGKRLADYIHGDACDYTGARHIINGTDRASTIAGFAREFEAALKTAERPSMLKPEAPVTDVLPPIPRTVTPTALKVSPGAPPPPLSQDTPAPPGFFARFLAAFAKAFRKGHVS